MDIGKDGVPIRARERWVDTVRRVTEGTFSILLEHVRENNIKGWNPEQVSKESRAFFELLYGLKWTPPGRGLWSMGTAFVNERGNYEALQNCGFVSTKDIAKDGGNVFAWFMEMLMVGVGVGADLKGAGTIRVLHPQGRTFIYDIPDTRQGWAESVRLLIDSYLDGGTPVEFAYHLIRARGTPIRGYGGFAEGPEILMDLHERVRHILDENAGQRISGVTLADIFNLIGRCVVAGNVRRSAEILFGSPSDDNFLNLKNPDAFAERNTYPGGWGAFSNNTIFAVKGMDYGSIAKHAFQNGEPGFLWLENAQNFGRMDGIGQHDPGTGGNPCLEQILEPWELCTLAELHLPRIADKAEFLQAVKASYLYAKIVTLTSRLITNKNTRYVMTKNRRIGLSCSGITQFEAQYDRATMLDWMDHGYHKTGYWDRRWSQWLEVPESVRRTSVKPSGTVSLLSGITPGIHYPIGRYYLRRMRLSSGSSLVPRLTAAGYVVEPDYSDPTGTVVAVFPIDTGVDVPAEADINPLDHIFLAADVASAWADNAVSLTVKFDAKFWNEADMVGWLTVAEERLKSISFLRDDGAVYPQMPYERITEEEYVVAIALLQPLDLSGVGHEMEDEYCDGEACELPASPFAAPVV